MNNKRTWIDKLSDFISGKGFYLVVLVCVAAIALSGWYLVQGVRGGLEDTLDQPVSGSAAIADRPSAQPTPRPAAKPSDPPAAASARLETAPSAAPSVQPAPTPTPAPAPLVFTWPVKGEIVAGFSVEALAYNQTMGDWRTHNGLDIAADRGAQVLAAAAGTVSALYQDDLMGTVVEIDHGQGLVSQYANLAATPTVEVGDAVDTGTIIGSVGGTAALESGLASHIHYALLKEGYPVDPADYLPQR
ncbi:MAG: M23 family metallopeptidase [Oscillospiraceae bacterium]|jgi:murein DD-endopeptidase MepM/ murein hydrolase activator NlpD|nr:M23 family metallopeptidase [Oscillospiraceae bacterium]